MALLNARSVSRIRTENPLVNNDGIIGKMMDAHNDLGAKPGQRLLSSSQRVTLGPFNVHLNQVKRLQTQLPN